ncbi:hypothetical protein ACHAXN_002862 [Cyclotella atomus]
MSPVPEAVPSIVPILTDSDTSLNGEASDSSLSGCDATALPSIAPIVTVFKSTQSNKRPQMKYDPEVPLSKEETSAWRREQRRKRNRESAAACRKRQRDRITELEVEVSEWKAKFDDAIRKLGQIEGQDGATVQVRDIERKHPEKRRCTTPSSSDSEDNEPINSTYPVNSYNMVTPIDSRSKFIPPIVTSVGDIDFPVLQETSIKAESAFIKADSFKSRVEKGQHLSEMITRPAESRLYLFRQRQLGSCFVHIPTQ